jgi:hypothetical protein
MPEEAQPPSLVVPVAVAICAGALACVAAFVTRKFVLLFLSAGSLWVLFLFYLYRLWWPGVPNTLSDVWLAVEEYYGILKQWGDTFESEWTSTPKSPVGA